MPSQDGLQTAMGQAKKSDAKQKRELLESGQLICSETARYVVVDVLGSGGFGDVYKVYREEDFDHFYALKTEDEKVKDRLRRLKMEAEVLAACGQAKRPHFLSLIDKGRTPKFKFIVMEVVGPSLDKVRQALSNKCFTRPTATKICVQLLESLKDLHAIGYLHRDLKPQNFSIGLTERKLIYMLDFGVSKPYLTKDGKHIAPRVKVAFMGTIRFASRGSLRLEEQSRRDDLESMMFVMADAFNETYLHWKGQRSQMMVLQLKDCFMNERGPHVDGIFRNLPPEYVRCLRYVNKLEFDTLPSYDYLINEMKTPVKTCSLPLDWMTELYTAPQSQCSPRMTAVATRLPALQWSGESTNTTQTMQTARMRASTPNRKKPSSVVKAKEAAVEGHRDALMKTVVKRRPTANRTPSLLDVLIKEENKEEVKEKKESKEESTQPDQN